MAIANAAEVFRIDPGLFRVCVSFRIGREFLQPLGPEGMLNEAPLVYGVLHEGRLKFCRTNFSYFDHHFVAGHVLVVREPRDAASRH